MKYKPADVGLPFKEVPFLSVGECIENPWNKFDFVLHPAHAHRCPNSLYRRCLCFASERIFKSRLVMWHEYAHVLTHLPYIVLDCSENHLDDTIQFVNKKELQKWNEGHNSEWTEIMESFGLKASRYINEGDLDDTW